MSVSDPAWMGGKEKKGRKRRNQQTWCNLRWVGLKLVKELTNVLKCLNRDLLRTNAVMC